VRDTRRLHVAPSLAGLFRTYWFGLRGHGNSDAPLTGYAIAEDQHVGRARLVALTRPTLPEP
jgi:hypothetical protein